MAETDVIKPGPHESRLALVIALLDGSSASTWLRKLPELPGTRVLVWLGEEVSAPADLSPARPDAAPPLDHPVWLNAARPWQLDDDGRLVLGEHASGAPLDTLLSSLAAHHGNQTLVVRVGRGAGARGLEAVRAAGGVVLVDAPGPDADSDLVVPSPAALAPAVQRLVNFAGGATATSQSDELLARLGHELRNPLAAISNAVELQRMLALDNSRLERSRTIIARQAAHMGRLVDALVDLSRLTRGRLRLRKEPVDLADIVRRHCDQLATETVRAGLDLELDIANGSLEVLGDRTRLTRVVDNLIDNALKNTHTPGRVVVEVRRTRDEIVLAVRDTGRGLADDERETIFEPFAVLTGEGSARGGLGLGLPLVRGFTRQHGGTVEVHSKGLGHGAEFVVRLPASEALDQQPQPVIEPPPTQPESAPVHEGRTRILVVEDNADNRMLMRDMLRMAGHEVELACDGREALDATARFQPQVVLCDIGLPDDMSGYDVARALRDTPSTHAPRLIAVTGFGMQRDLDRAREAGFDAHLTKPIDLDRLIALIDEQLELWHSS